MNIELTEQEVADIVQSLRSNEKQSRIGFGNHLKKTLEAIPADELASRIERARAAFARLAALRAKFGDTKPLNTD